MTDSPDDHHDETPATSDREAADVRAEEDDDATADDADEAVEQAAEEAREDADEAARKEDIDHQSTEREADALEQENPDGHRDEKPYQS